MGKGTTKKGPSVQNAQPVLPNISAFGPMNATNRPSADSSSVVSNTHQPQTPSHNLSPLLPAPPPATTINPYGTPPPGVAALKPPAGIPSGIPNNQLAQKKGTQKKMPSVPNQNDLGVFPLFSATGPMNSASGPPAGTSSVISQNQQQAQTPFHSLAPSLPAPQAVMQPLEAAPTGVAAQGQQPAGTSSVMPSTHQAHQTFSHNLAPSHSLAPSHNLTPSAPAPAAATQPPGEPSSTSIPPHGLSARTIRKLARRLAGESPSPEREPSRMPYPNPAIAPETAEEHSIYPMNRQMRRDRGEKYEGETLDTFIGQLDPWMGSGDPELDLQHLVRMAGYQLWVDKGMPMNPLPARAAPKVAEMMGTVDQDSRNGSDRETSGGNPTISEEKCKDKSTVFDESMNRDGAADSDEDVERDFTMFEDTPPDASLVPEHEEWNLPPYNEPSSPPRFPSLTALSELPTWDPSLDPAYQFEAQWNVEKWDDFRFKVPRTDSDMDSLQQALEITRMDFWIRNPYEEYPREAPYKGESYGSQHRRLQHAFCRLWRECEAEGGPAAALFRLPGWSFGFEACYWTPASWGMDKRSEVYHRGLAEMAAEKNEEGLQRVRYGDWKAKLEEEDRAVMAEAETPLALFAGSRGRQ